MSKVTTALYSSFKQPCLKAESELTGCLNSGTCFKIPVHNGGRIIGCSCTEEWEGARCEFRYIDPELWAHDASMASIAAGITLGVFLLLASIVGVVIYWWRYSNNRRQSNCEPELDEVRGNDHVLVSPNESKPSYDGCIKTESRQNFFIAPEASTPDAHETVVSQAEHNEIASCSSSSSSSAAVEATAKVVLTMHHLSLRHSPADCPFIDEECTACQQKTVPSIVD